MTKEKYLKDLKDIKSIMERSSRFISLSGLSGVWAGVLALGGAYLAYRMVYEQQDYMNYRVVILTSQTVQQLIGIALGVLMLSVGGGIWFGRRKAQKLNLKFWDSQAKRLTINLAIPLIAGGLLCLTLLSNGLLGLIAPLTLVFYGLALINASKYTLTEIRSLGLYQVGLGLIGCYFIGYGLLLWALGFGILHIIYGVVMYIKYES